MPYPRSTAAASRLLARPSQHELNRCHPAGRSGLAHWSSPRFSCGHPRRRRRRLLRGRRSHRPWCPLALRCRRWQGAPQPRCCSCGCRATPKWRPAVPFRLGPALRPVVCPRSAPLASRPSRRARAPPAAKAMKASTGRQAMETRGGGPVRALPAARTAAVPPLRRRFLRHRCAHSRRRRRQRETRGRWSRTGRRASRQASPKYKVTSIGL